MVQSRFSFLLTMATCKLSLILITFHTWANGLTTTTSPLTDLLKDLKGPRILGICGSQRVGSFNRMLHDHAMTVSNNGGGEMASARDSSSPTPMTRPTFQITPKGAERAIVAAEAEAAANGWNVTICISDAGGVPVLVKRNNAFAASYEIAVGKARSAALFGRETAVLEAAANVSGGVGRASLLSSSFVLMRGGVPIVIDGICCGAVGVSGVKPDQDEQVARAATSVLTSLVSKL